MSKITIVLIACLFVFGFAACAAEGANVAPTLCGDCGQFKGNDSCCAADAEGCSDCDLAKGSPGCCKMEKGTDKPVCTGCGQIKGSGECCKEDAAKCGDCALAKGSPGCCKLDKK